MKKYILLTLVLAIGIVALYFVKPQLFKPIPKFKDNNSVRYISPNVNITIILNSVSLNIPAKSQQILFSKTSDTKNSNDVCMSETYKKFWSNRDEEWKQYIGENANGYINTLYNSIPKNLRQESCEITITELVFNKHVFSLYCPKHESQTIPIFIKDMNYKNIIEYEKFINQIKQYDIEIEEFGPPIIINNFEETTYC